MNVTDLMPTAIRPWAKAAATLVLAFLSALYLVIDGGVTAREWVEVAISTLTITGLGAYAPRNDPREEDGESADSEGDQEIPQFVNYPPDEEPEAQV